MKKKDIRILSLKELYHMVREDHTFNPTNTIAIISSSFPVDEDLLSCAGLRYVVCIYDDIDRDCLGRYFSLLDANKIARFFKANENEASTILCVCNGGVRRSSAIAATLHRYYRQEQDELGVWQNPMFEPNPLVFRTMAYALSVPVTDVDIDLRIWENRTAFKNRIKGGCT